MILVDANLLVYAHVGSFAQHAAARGWLSAAYRTERHQEILAPLMKSAEGRANLVPDAHVAALAIECVTASGPASLKRPRSEAGTAERHSLSGPEPPPRENAPCHPTRSRSSSPAPCSPG